MNHMAAHIYQQVGMYHEAMGTSLRAVAADERVHEAGLSHACAPRVTAH